jgi:sugar phosphate isomerase/epimerase
MSRQPGVASPRPFEPGSIGLCLETLADDPYRSDISSFERHVQASSAAGFHSVALWSWRAAEIGVETARKVLDHAGVTVRLTECRIKWAEGPQATTVDLERELDLVDALGAEMVLAVSKETSIDIPQAADGFAALCERAADRGVRVTIEFIPCRGLRDLATAWAVVRRSGAVNGGLDIDMMHWHNQPGGPDFELLRTIPATHLHYVQVCDAARPAPSPEKYIETAIRARPLPGDGVVDIRALVETLSEAGADPFFAMEVYNAELAAAGPEAMAQRLRAVADTIFD